MYCAFIGPPTTAKPAQSHRDRPAPTTRLGASLHVLDALDQIGVLRAVLVPYRLHRVLERLLVKDLGDIDAGLLDLLDGFLFHLVPELALLLLCFLRELRDQRLVVG